jgi:LPS-assembly protein
VNSVNKVLQTVIGRERILQDTTREAAQTTVGRKHKLLRQYVFVLSAASIAVFVSAGPAVALKEKPFVKPITDTPAAGTAADFAADKLTYDPRTKLAVATGKVVITYGPYVLNATLVSFNQETGAFKANGSVVLREPNGNVLQAASLELHNKFRDGFAQHLKALLTNDVTITARYAKRIEGHITVFEDAHYTACKNCETKSGDPLWELVSDQTTHDSDTKTLYHVKPRLKIAGVTVAGLPYLEHADPSVKRRTGWLVPDVNFGSAYGAGLTTPYFWAIGPDRDLTFRPMLTLKQGPVADVEYRQRTASGLYKVRGFGVYELSPKATSENRRLRGAIKTEGDFKLNENWDWGWNGTLTSDREFLDNYDFDSRNISQNEVYLRGLWGRNYVSAQALNFASLSDNISNDTLPTALPYASGEHYLNQQILGGDLRFNWSVYSLMREDPDTPFTDVNHGSSQSRAMANLSWKSRYIADGGMLITPFASLRSDIYVGNNVPDPTVVGGFRDKQSIARVLPSGGVDVRWPFIASHDYGHSVFSPVFQFIAAGDEKKRNQIGNEDAITLNFDQSSLFLEDRFTGLDRYESGLRSNVGFTYSFLGNNGGFLKLSGGESFHFSGDNSFVSGSGLDGSKSDLVGALNFQPWDNLSLSYQLRAEEDLSAINRQEIMGSLTFDRFSMNAGYLDIAAEPAYGRLTDEKWAEADVRIGLTDGWYAFGGLRYDLENSYFLSQTAGVEFDCDCMNFKFAYSGKRADTGNVDHRVMMSIDLATLGGTKVSAGF